MRKLLITVLLGIIASSTYAQKEPAGFLSRIPDLPGGVCSMTGKQRSQYMHEVNKLLRDLDDEISIRKKVIKTDVEKSRRQIENNLAKEYGLSDTDVQKMKNKKMSKEEKRALADKALQEKAGISMKEIENLKKMSKEGKKAWVEGYSTQQMANVTGNPDANKTEEQLEMEKTLEKNRKLNDLVKEQTAIVARIAASDKAYMNRLTELDKEDSVATKHLDEQRKPLLKRLNAGASDEDAREIQREIRRYEMNYCSKLTPHHIAILGECLASLLKFMPDHKRLEEINAELNKSTLRTDKDFSSPGLMQLEAVRSYVRLLEHTFKYAHYTFSEEQASEVTE